MFWHKLLFVIVCSDNDLLFDLANMLYLKLSIFINFLRESEFSKEIIAHYWFGYISDGKLKFVDPC